MNWIKENIKTAISIFSTISLVIGFIISTYINNTTIRSDLDNTKMALQELKSIISDQQESYDKMMWFLMNRKETETTKAKGIK